MRPNHAALPRHKQLSLGNTPPPHPTPQRTLAKSATRSSGSTIMRWQSSGLSVTGRSASTTCGGGESAWYGAGMWRGRQ